MQISDPSPPGRPISRFASGLLKVYLVWMAIGLVVTVLGLTPHTLSSLALPHRLSSFVAFCLVHGDPVSMGLAAACTLALIWSWGSRAAGGWFAVVVTVSAVVETIGTLWGWPFGPYHYTDDFGPRIAGVLPVVIPLSWFVLITNAGRLVRALGDLPATVRAFLTGLVVTVLDWVMEPFAVRIKHYWVWDGGTIPLQNYLAWFILASILACGVPRASQMERGAGASGLILGPMLILFLIGRAVHHL